MAKVFVNATVNTWDKFVLAQQKIFLTQKYSFISLLRMSSHSAGEERSNKLLTMNTGCPSASSLHLAGRVLGEGTQHLLTTDVAKSGDFLMYGPLGGEPSVKNNFAKFLSSEYGYHVTDESLFLTSGASQGLAFVMNHLFPTGAPVFVEDPSYFLALKMIKEDYRMTCIPVEIDEQGMNVEQLRHSINEHQSSMKKLDTSGYPFSGLLYLIPTFHNPTGIVYSEGRCRDLIELAHTHNLLVLCDDVYNLLYFSGSKPPRSMFSIEKESHAKDGHVISNGSFSKILATGLRVGWIESSEKVLKLLNSSFYALSGGSFSHYNSQVVSSALTLGIMQRHLQMERAKLKEHRDVLHDYLQHHLPPSTKVFFKAEGGYFLWVQLPDGVDCNLLKEKLLSKYHLQVVPGASFSVRGLFKNCLRLSFSYYERNDLLDGAERLCSALQNEVTSHL